MKTKNKENQLSPAENHLAEDEVAQRAYELYEARGREPGHDLEDWLHAELEVNERHQLIQTER